MGVRASAAVCLFLVCVAVNSAEAQYFGRNKVRYVRPAFDLIKTEHFDIYVRPDAIPAAETASRLAERWYARLSAILDHQLSSRQVLVLYSSHTEFEQTNVVSDGLGETIGGVTEGMMRRIVLPFDTGLGETNHVIGHELVHAFQYDIANTDRRSLAGAPLWFIEGMAEYLSVGGSDPFTSMVLRDAVLHDRLLSIRRLSRNAMSPYRSGQAFWTWLASEFGDGIIRKTLSAHPRDVVKRIEEATGTDVDVLNDRWRESIKTAAGDAGRRPIAEGHLLIGAANGGQLNMSPALSPDGSRLLFMSERDRHSIDVFIADAATGRVAMKPLTLAKQPDVESLGFLRSSGAWSPDSSRVVLALVKQGEPVFSVYDVAHARLVADFPVHGIDQISQPAWSPDGSTIAFSGLNKGASDLYLYRLSDRSITRLTNDWYADLEPAWSPDGRRLAFVTDRFTTDLSTLQFGTPQIATVDLSSGLIVPIQTAGENATNPLWSSDSALVFRSVVDGVSNVFMRSLDGTVSQLTHDSIGVSGITAFSPALSISRETGRIAFSVLRSGEYQIRSVDTGTMTVLDGTATPASTSAANTTGGLAGWLADPRAGLPAVASIPVARYASRLSFVGIAAPSLSMSTGTGGNVLHAGTSALFTDLLGDRNLEVALQAGTRLEDVNVDATYTNRMSRWTYGANVDASPYEALSGERQLHAVASGLLIYPIHRSLRVEMRTGVHAAYYDRSTAPFRAWESRAAVVTDTAVLGAISPLLGRRLRFELTSALGDANYVESRADYRQYWMFPRRPISIAARGLHAGRFGSGASDQRLVPLSLRRDAGVRGAAYDARDEGSQLLAAQFELRFPALALIKRRLTRGAVPVEGFGFGDAGVVWRPDQSTRFGAKRPPFLSTGAGARIRLEGFVLESAAAYRFDPVRQGWSWSLNVRPPF